jgi:hypothetical protein
VTLALMGAGPESPGGGGGGGFSAVVLAEPSLVSYWRLNEPSGVSAADSKGTNPGTYVGAPTLGVAGALTDGSTAVAFSGAGTQRVDVAHAASLALTGAFTLEAWVNPTDRANFYWIVAKTSGALPAPFEWRLENTTGLPNLLYGDGGASPGTVVGTTAPALGVWSHVAVTVTAGLTPTVTHYLNGAPNGSAVGASHARADGGLSLRLATRDDLFAGFKGGLDEIPVYNAVLSGASLAAHFAAR